MCPGWHDLEVVNAIKSRCTSLKVTHFISAVTEMFHQTSVKCVHSTLFAAPTRTFLYLPAVKSVVGHHSENRWMQANGLVCHPADKYALTHRHTYLFIIAGGGFEAVTNCPASWAHPWRASSVLLFDADLVINSDKSVSSSLLMCTQHQHTRTHAIHIYHNWSQDRVWGRWPHVDSANPEK